MYTNLEYLQKLFTIKTLGKLSLNYLILKLDIIIRVVLIIPTDDKLMLISYELKLSHILLYN